MYIFYEVHTKYQSDRKSKGCIDGHKNIQIYLTHNVYRCNNIRLGIILLVYLVHKRSILKMPFLSDILRENPLPRPDSAD